MFVGILANVQVNQGHAKCRHPNEGVLQQTVGNNAHATIMQ